MSQPSEASDARRETAAADARAARRAVLTALLLSVGAHAIAIGALAGLTLSGGGPVSIDSAPIPIRIRLAPAAGGGADGAARESGTPAAPGDAGAAQPEPALAPDVKLIVDAAPPEPVAPPPPTTPPAAQPDVARWLLEVQADPRDVVSTPAYATPTVPAEAPELTAAAPPAPVATTDEWQGPPAPAPQLAAVPHGMRPPDIGLFGDGDGLGAGFGAAGGSAGHGGGEGGGDGTGVGPGPGGREGGTGLFPVPLGDNVAPEYPLAARRAGEEGLVVIHAQVLADGSVADAHIGESSGYERLDDAALAAVLSWRFQPALHDGKPVAQAVDVPIRFRLRAR